MISRRDIIMDIKVICYITNEILLSLLRSIDDRWVDNQLVQLTMGFNSP